MTELRIEKKVISTANFNGESTLPSVSEVLRLSFMQDKFVLDEDDGLFVNYGNVDYAYPYKVQDNYDRELVPTEHETVVLENEYLKATFMPHLGGKLWSLYDKKEEKELLFENSVVRPCHLGIRNAWLSGGVEWNCGYIGHNPFTCDRLHTAETKLEDGTPVLRFYQYERIRGIIYQMDFFLPEDSKLLYARMKIINPRYEVLPMYWWSNIGVVDYDTSRVIVPADESYTGLNGYPQKIDIPMRNGIDVTYPTRNPVSIDYFWKTHTDKRKYITQVDGDGYGLVQTSTQRLKGRKLFVWGDSEGGKRWKNFLTADDESGSYSEIQCGLTFAQFECIPMPPKTNWEWLEGYGAMNADPKKAHGEWAGAKAEVEQKLSEMATEEYMEQLLIDTKKMASSPAEKVLFEADGWGALEVYRREAQNDDATCTYLDFGDLTEEQLIWKKLMEEGTLGEHDPKQSPISYMLQKEWTVLIEKAAAGKDKENWFTHMQLGLIHLVSENHMMAGKYLRSSLRLQPSAWAYYGLAILNRKLDKHTEEVRYMRMAYELASDDASLAKAYLRCLHENKKYRLLEKVYLGMNKELQAIERCHIYYAYALVDRGDVKGAEAILYKNGYIEIPDIRECETITSDLWYLIEAKKAEQNGTEFDAETAMPPQALDFRMFTNLSWFNETDGKEE